MSDNTSRIAETTTATPGTPDRPRFALTFSARDLLNVAIFAVIYFVIVFAIAMLGIISPLVMLITLPLSIVAAGIPYMLFLTRVRHTGMVTLFGIVVAVLYLIVGHPWISTIVTILASLLAEAILWAGKNRSRWAAIGAYTLFSLWFVGPWIPLLVNRTEYLNSAGMQMMGPDYIDTFNRIVSVPALLALFAASIVCGLLGGLLGTVLLKKHFIKAGLA